MTDMFNGCNNLNVIYVGNRWIVEKVENQNMFKNCGTDHVTQKATPTALTASFNKYSLPKTTREEII